MELNLNHSLNVCGMSNAVSNMAWLLQPTHNKIVSAFLYYSLLLVSDFVRVMTWNNRSLFWQIVSRLDLILGSVSSNNVPQPISTVNKMGVYFCTLYYLPFIIRICKIVVHSIICLFDQITTYFYRPAFYKAIYLVVYIYYDWKHR
jgi:hypothetical protein